MPVRLGKLLLKENMVSPQQLQEALDHQKLKGGTLAKAFVALGFVKDEEITSLLSRQYGVPMIDRDHFEVDPAVIKIILPETARKYLVLPVSFSGMTLTLAMADPANVFAVNDIKFMTGYNVQPVVASEGALEVAIDRYYGSARSLNLRGDSGAVQGGNVLVKSEVEQAAEAVIEAAFDWFNNHCDPDGSPDDPFDAENLANFKAAELRLKRAILHYAGLAGRPPYGLWIDEDGTMWQED